MELKSRIVVACAVFLLFGGVAFGDWFEGDEHKMHYPQMPDPHGWAVCFWRVAIGDDFECSQSGPITDIHFWISWKGDRTNYVPQWSILICENLVTSDGASRPGRELWRFKRGNITIRQAGQSKQGWLCPLESTQGADAVADDHERYFQVNITEIQNPFEQTTGEVYWLVIRANVAIYDAAEYATIQPEAGWKTSVDHWGSPAVWARWPYDVTRPHWMPVTSPDVAEARNDMAFVITGIESPPERLDFGDAPEIVCITTPCPSYPTTLGRNGARHVINSGVYLGDPYTDMVHIDAEADGQPSASADGDDLNEFDDEDGVMFVSPIVPGEQAEVKVLASVKGYLNAWIDFNADNDWDDFGEQIFVAEPVVSGNNLLVFDVPQTNADHGAHETYARFRFGLTEHVSYSGLARSGEVEDYIVRIEEQPQPRLDFGDAPQLRCNDIWGRCDSYPTTLAEDGARHIVNQKVRLGRYVDAEPDGQPDIEAEGDDVAGLDDEDGVFFVTPMVPGLVARVEVIASVEGFLNAWIDFDDSGNWEGPGEQIFVDQPLAAGSNLLEFDVPDSAAANVHTYARFRFSTEGGLGYTGPGREGEVEDYQVSIDRPQPEFDFGDAPEMPCAASVMPGCPCNNYPTMLARNGARHIIDPDIFLGAFIDGEWDGQPTVAADGDDTNGEADDEDGVVFVTSITPGFKAKVEVTASVGGFLNAWIDFNADGDWDDYGEQIFAGERLEGGVNYLEYDVPRYPYAIAGNARTYARFRFSTQEQLRYGGPARNGEVEDYLVRIEEPPERGADLGDAPDSTNNFGEIMTAYPSMGMQEIIVRANYPTVFRTGSPPYGPIHRQPEKVAHLGPTVSREREADFGFDEDPTNNLIPRRDQADRDGADDGVRVPLVMPHGRRTRFEYLVNVINPVKQLYVNVWFDFNRDGDWDDVIACDAANEVTADRGLAREWAVRNQLLTNLSQGLHSITTPPFVSWHGRISSDYKVAPIWMRITLSERPWQALPTFAPMDGMAGSGPPDGYWIGETEDYFFTPITRRLEHADLDGDKVVNSRDFAIFALQWLSVSQ